MQINVESRDFIGAELGKLTGNATQNKQQSQFRQLLGKQSRVVVGSATGDSNQLPAESETKAANIAAEPAVVMPWQLLFALSETPALPASADSALDTAQNSAQNSAALNAEPTAELCALVITDGLSIQRAKGEYPTNSVPTFSNSKVILKTREQNQRIVSSSLQQLSGQQHYAAMIVNHGPQSSHKLSVISPWGLIATGYLSYDAQDNTAQTAVSTSVTNGILPTSTRQQLGHSAEASFDFNTPSRLTLTADWTATAEPFQAPDSIEEQTELLSTHAVDEWLSPLLAEHLMVLPDADQKERLYYRNFNAQDPEQALKQVLQLWQPVNLRHMDLYINGHFSKQGDGYAS